MDTISNKQTGSFFGESAGGKQVKVFTIRNKHGVELKAINYGGIVTSLKVPDKNGVMADVVLGFDSLQRYEDKNPYYGALIGRCGNRIAGGRFNLDDKIYFLPVNNGPNHLHGGDLGFHEMFWDIIQNDSSSLTLTYRSVDGEMGYPGNLDVTVVYSLTDQNEFRIDYEAVTDMATIVNLTQHSYFNLAGHDQGDILDHELVIYGDHFLPVDKTLIPTGELRKVSNTPFDFRKRKRIGSDIESKDEQLIFGNGYDHCWVMNDSSSALKEVATLHHHASGRVMTVLSTEPALQFYSGNFMDGRNIGKGNFPYQFRYGLCLETQHYPDSPNHPSFPDVVLNPGETYRTTTVYRFSAQ